MNTFDTLGHQRRIAKISADMREEEKRQPKGDKAVAVMAVVVFVWLLADTLTQIF